MADRVEHFTVTAPAGTTQAAPLEIPVAFNPGEVERFDIVVPDGHAGLTGIALALAHQPIVPATRGRYFIANDETIPLPMENLPNSGAWSAWVFNTDVFEHSWYLRILVREVGRAPLILEPTVPGQIVSVPGSGNGGDVELPPPDETEPPIEEEPPPDSEPPPEEEPPPDESEPPEPVDELPPEPELPPEDVEPEPAPAPVELPPPPTPVIPTYALPVNYEPGGLGAFGYPPNLGMLIGTVLGHALAGQGSNASGSFNTWRFFSDLGNTYDWNFYFTGVKALQWVGPFNLRTGVPGG